VITCVLNIVHATTGCGSKVDATYNQIALSDKQNYTLMSGKILKIYTLYVIYR